jgi:hypothetical protein
MKITKFHSCICQQVIMLIQIDKLQDLDVAVLFKSLTNNYGDRRGGGGGGGGGVGKWAPRGVL